MSKTAKKLILLAALASLATGCGSGALSLDSSFWPRMAIGTYEYRAASSDPVNKPWFDTLEVYQIGGFPFYDRTLVGSFLTDPMLGPEASITIDPSLSGTALVVRVWGAKPLPAYAADPLFQFPSANACYLFDVSNPAAPIPVGYPPTPYPTFF